MKRPASLKSGDKIGIVAPARKVSMDDIQQAIIMIEEAGFKAVYDDSLFDQDRQFAGDDHSRIASFQRMLDDDEVKAIISARGGYGSIRVIDGLNFERFEKTPKWIIGYSDITVFHSHIVRNELVQTLHATMLLNFLENSNEALLGMFEVLEGKNPEYTLAAHQLNREGNTRGVLCGGNLSVLYSMMGSKSFPETDGKILFLEDLDEYLYHIDRMMMALKRAGILENLSGLIVGGMTDMNDNTIPFGRTAEEIISEAVAEYKYPVCYGFPAGHIDDNRPLIMGAEIVMEVGENVILKFE